MSATQAICPRGTVTSYASLVAPTVFADVAEVIAIKRTGAKHETDDATNMDSTSGYREYIATIKVGGEYQLDVNFLSTDSGQRGVKALFESGDAVNWKITLPNGAGLFLFTGIVTEYGNLSLPVDKKATDSFKVMVTGGVEEDFAS